MHAWHLSSKDKYQDTRPTENTEDRHRRRITSIRPWRIHQMWMKNNTKGGLRAPGCGFNPTHTKRKVTKIRDLTR
jgi:hypothetical protein